ncbi:MAG TPA: alpha/beta fold hydrolase [Candidatus Udaeobacter sp.]|jgi:pimeloyl-ACP methyl ester carboxylesterase|nr:alpha/beta fold hydrolase [Candidatus Udaeobacter sp.]
MRVLSAVLGAVFALSGCATSRYAEVWHKKPRLTGPPGTGSLALAEQNLTRAIHEERAKPLAALGDCLEALRSASNELRRNPGNLTAARDYNFGVSRIFQIIHDANLDPWTQPLNLPTTHGDFVLTYKPDPRPEWNPALYEFTPADEFDVGGKYVTERTTRDGIGAPIVAVEKQASETRRQKLAPSRIFRTVTAVAEFRGNRCILEFYDPLDSETAAFYGRTVPLAADFTVPLAVMLQQTDPGKHELWRVLNPEKYAHTAAIERLQPYNPNKTVVLVIHGLKDSQATWTPMINKLRGDPVIRKHYQFWFYSYPSGYPFPYSAAILRQELDEVEKQFPKLKPMVVIGHSMGGCISRLLLTDSGNQLCMKIFGRPLDEVPLSPKTREYFRDELFFRHRPEIGRVIFIAAPLRGSTMASGLIGQLATLLIRESTVSSQASQEMLRATNIREEELKPKRRANSVDSLSPKSRFVNAVNTIPITPGVPYHTIIGDRGRGDSPNSSDGVVPYWSSHMDGAKTENIVPSDHAAHQNPQAIEDVLRILKTHAR